MDAVRVLVLGEGALVDRVAALAAVQAVAEAAEAEVVVAPAEALPTPLPPRPVVAWRAAPEAACELALLRQGVAEVVGPDLAPAALRQALLRARARGQAPLAAAAQEAQALVENAQDVITVLAGDGTIRFQSPAVERVLGYAPQALLGRNAFDLIHPDDLARVAEVFTRGLQQPGFTATLELRMRHRQRHWVTLESRAKNLVHDPVIGGIIVNSRDVSDRKAAEEALRRSEARHRALVEALPDAMVRIARDGTYLDVHLPRDYQAVADPAALVGLSAYDVLPADIARQAMAAVEAALATGHVQRFEYEIEAGGEQRVREARVVVSGEDEVISIQRDITEPKRREAALRESERRFRLLVEAIPDAMVRVRRDGSYHEVKTPHGFSWLVAPDELVGHSAYEVLAPELAGHLMAATHRALDTGTTQVVEYAVTTTQGERYREARVVPLDDDEVISLLRDITERRRAEEEVRRLKAFYEQVLNDLPADVSVMDPEGRIRYLNTRSVADPALRAWLIGRTGEDYCRRRGLDPALAQRRQRHLEEAVASRRIVQFEEVIRRADGTRRHILRMASPVFAPDGSVAQVIGYGLDITDRKQAEEALQQSEALLRTVVTNVPVILFALDRRGRFTLWEGKGLEPLGGTPGELVGQSVFERFGALDHFAEHVDRVQRGVPFSTILGVADRTFECWLNPVIDEGRVVGTIGVAADITEIKRSEQALKQSREQLRRLALHLQSVREEERARIAREVHDVLGQSLTAIRMDVAWLEKGLHTEQEGLRHRLDDMKGLVDTTIQTVRRIATDLRPGILDDLGLAAALEWQAREFAQRTGIVCRFVDESGDVDLERGRATALFRIFQEMLTNVARHAEARHVDIALRRDGDHLMLVVADDGRGITPREVSSRRSLGLLGMRERVLPWGGWFEIAGTPGQGTRASVRMPLAETPALGIPEAPAPSGA